MLKIERTRFEEGEKSKSGKYEYSGWYYRMTVGDISYIVRQYDGTMDEAAFLKARAAGKDVIFASAPYDDPGFREAVAYLLRELKVTRPKMMLPNGYEYLDLSRLG